MLIEKVHPRCLEHRLYVFFAFVIRRRNQSLQRIQLAAARFSFRHDRHVVTRHSFASSHWTMEGEFQSRRIVVSRMSNPSFTIAGEAF